MNDINIKQQKHVEKYFEDLFQETDCMERDDELEKYLVQKSKIELRLLMNLESDIFDEWDKSSELNSHPNMIDVGEFYYIVNHNHLFKPNQKLINNSNIGFFWSLSKKYYLGDIIVMDSGTNNDNIVSPIIERAEKIIETDKNILYVRKRSIDAHREFIYTPTVSLFAIHNSYKTEQEAVAKLETLTGINDDILCTKNWFDGRTGWKQYQIMQDIGKYKPNSHEQFYPFYNAKNFITCIVAKNTKTQTLLPITAWTKDRIEQRYYLNIPPLKPYPLSGLPNIHKNQDSTIFLTNSNEIAFENQRMLDDKEIFDKRWVTWPLGEKDPVADVDFSCLKKHPVYYFISEHGSSETAFDTAYAVYTKLKEVGLKDLHFIEYKKVDRQKTNFIFLSCEEFEKKAKVILGLEEEQEDLKFSPKPIKQILNEQLPEREFLLEPILHECSTNLLYSMTNAGKSWLGLCMALIVSSAGTMFTRWTAKKPRRTLYIDCELHESSIQKRIKLISKMQFDGKKYINGKLNNFFCISKRRAAQSALSNDEFQKHVLEFVQKKNIAFVVLDNLSAFTQHNDSAKCWEDIHSWFDQLKLAGASVLAIHHSTKTGEQQRGTSATTNAVDNVIHIKKVKISDDQDEIGMSIYIEKGRDIYGIAKKPFKVQLCPDANPPYCKFCGEIPDIKEEETKKKTNKKSSSDSDSHEKKPELDASAINASKIKVTSVKRKHKIPEERKIITQEIYKKLEEGKAISLIAAELDVSIPSIYQIKGLTQSKAYQAMKGKNIKDKANRNSNILGLYASTADSGQMKEIAKGANISITTARRIIEEMYIGKIAPFYKAKKVYSIDKIAEKVQLNNEIVERIIKKLKMDEIPKLYNDGKSSEEINEQLELSIDDIEKVIGRIELEKEKKAGRQNAMDKLRALHQKGFALTEIIKQIDLPARTIKVEFNRLNKV